MIYNCPICGSSIQATLRRVIWLDLVGVKQDDDDTFRVIDEGLIVGMANSIVLNQAIVIPNMDDNEGDDEYSVYCANDHSWDQMVVHMKKELASK